MAKKDRREFEEEQVKDPDLENKDQDLSAPGRVWEAVKESVWEGDAEPDTKKKGEK